MHGRWLIDTNSHVGRGGLCCNHAQGLGVLLAVNHPALPFILHCPTHGTAGFCVVASQCIHCRQSSAQYASCQGRAASCWGTFCCCSHGTSHIAWNTQLVRHCLPAPAVDAICEVGAIDTLLSNFIIPLQGDQISTADGRVHCSLNLNTETGRLSARRPNLQNQPALEKDRYKARQLTAAQSLSAANCLWQLPASRRCQKLD